MSDYGDKRKAEESDDARKRARDDKSQESFVVRLRGLPYSVTDSDLHEFFSGLPIVPGGIVISFNHTGEGYVAFETAEAQSSAVQFDRKTIGKRYVEVFRASASDMEYARGQAQSKVGAVGSVASAGPVLKLRGLPFSVHEEEIARFFKGIPLAKTILVAGRDGRASGDAFVVLADEGQLGAAMALDKQKLGGRWVDIRTASAGELLAATSTGSITGSVSGGMGGGGGGGASHYGGGSGGGGGYGSAGGDVGAVVDISAFDASYTGVLRL
jgi:hypothetical protein